MSGITGLVEPGANYFQGPSVPLLSLHGNADPLVPYQADVDGYTRAKPPKFFLTFVGAGHIVPFLGGTDVPAMTLEQATVDFWDRYLKGSTAALGRLRADANVSGVTTLQEDTATITAPRSKP